MTEPIFTNFTAEHAANWGKAPLSIPHRLPDHPLFQIEALEELIESYPKEHYALVHMGAQGSPKKSWREGTIGNLSGREVIEAIERGRMWIHLYRVGQVDKRYGELLDKIFEEVRGHVPGYDTFTRLNGIIISSPGAQVYYHFDPAGQSLWQIKGQKRVYLYPPKPPFLTEESLEHVALYHDEVGIKYDPSFEDGAQCFLLEPGTMMHWPLNSPHRVENLDCLNISMTTEYWTEDIRRRQIVNTANGILRNMAGITPKSRATSGLGFWSKAAMQSVVRRTGVLEKERKARRPIQFQLDKQHLGSVVELPGAAE
jgi:hypothetical protein